MGRNARATAAFPLDDAPVPGRVFCTFPTETLSGLPFSINGHFFAAMDRRSIVNGGEHGAWNDRVNAHLGDALGEALEELLTCDISLPWEIRAQWLPWVPGGTTDTQR